MFQKNKGFTLIEIMITVVILGIIVAVALPSYQNYIQKSRRVEAKNLLMKINAEQEKYYFDNNAYFDDAYLKTQSWVKLQNGNVITENGFYQVSLSSTDLRADFLATATPSASSTQVNDKRCTSLTINQSNLQGATGSDPDSCW